MKKLIEAFPQNIIDATAIAKVRIFQKPKNEIHTIVICGLGGSGIDYGSAGQPRGYNFGLRLGF